MRIFIHTFLLTVLALGAFSFTLDDLQGTWSRTVYFRDTYSYDEDTSEEVILCSPSTVAYTGTGYIVGQNVYNVMDYSNVHSPQDLETAYSLWYGYTITSISDDHVFASFVGQDVCYLYTDFTGTSFTESITFANISDLGSCGSLAEAGTVACSSVGTIHEYAIWNKISDSVVSDAAFAPESLLSELQGEWEVTTYSTMEYSNDGSGSIICTPFPATYYADMFVVGDAFFGFDNAFDASPFNAYSFPVNAACNLIANATGNQLYVYEYDFVFCSLFTSTGDGGFIESNYYADAADYGVNCPSASASPTALTCNPDGPFQQFSIWKKIVRSDPYSSVTVQPSLRTYWPSTTSGQYNLLYDLTVTNYGNQPVSSVTISVDSSATVTQSWNLASASGSKSYNILNTNLAANAVSLTGAPTSTGAGFIFKGAAPPTLRVVSVNGHTCPSASTSTSSSDSASSTGATCFGNLCESPSACLVNITSSAQNTWRSDAGQFTQFTATIVNAGQTALAALTISAGAQASAITQFYLVHQVSGAAATFQLESFAFPLAPEATYTFGYTVSGAQSVNWSVVSATC